MQLSATMNIRAKKISVQQKEDALHRLVDIWATGEASASLGFSAARFFDEFDSIEKKKNEIFEKQGVKGARAQFKTLREAQEKALEYLKISDQPRELLKNPENLSRREQLALSYTKSAVTDSNNIPEILFTKLKKEFSDAEIVELTAVIGMITMLNLFNNCLQVTYRGEYEKHAD